MAPPPGRTNEAIGTRAAIEPATGRMRINPDNKLDIFAGALDTDAPIAAAADHVDATPLLHLVPLEGASVEGSEEDVRVVRVELALIPAHDGFLARPPSCRGGGDESSGGSRYMNTKCSREFVIRPSWSSSSGSPCPCPSSSRSRHFVGADEHTGIALAYAAPDTSGIRMPQGGWEECVGDYDGESGAPVERECARRDGEWQARVDECAKVGRWELRAWGARRGGKDERFLFHFDRNWLGGGGC